MTAQSLFVADYPNGPNRAQAKAHLVDVDEHLYGGSVGGGKALALFTPLVTPNGCTTMGMVKVGDYLLDVAMQPTRVVGKSEIHYRDCYEVEFDKKHVIVASDEHRWVTLTAAERDAGATTVVRTTVDLLASMQAVHFVPVAGQSGKWHRLTRITKVPTVVPTQCIAVDSPSRTYLAGHAMIPTHNTDFLLAKLLDLAMRFPGSNSLMLRKSFAELNQRGGIIQRLETRIPPQVGKYNRSEHLWTFYNGSFIELGHLNNGDADLPRYLGGEYALICVDQCEAMTSFQVDSISSRLRVSGPVRDAMQKEGYRPKLILSANPTGIGLAWLKERFIDPAPGGGVVFREPATAYRPNPPTRCFTPARVEDNIENVGAEYLAILDNLPEDDRKALKEGSWDVYKGQRFSSFSTAVHVVDPEQFPIPEGGIARGLGIDYGQEQPFAALWGARLADDLVVIYREVYERGLSAEEQAKLILASEMPGERMQGRPIVTHLDPACWAPSPDKPLPRTAGGTVVRPTNAPPAGSIADTYQKAGLRCERADNRRIEGWADIASRLRYKEADGSPRPGGPRLLIYSTCTNLIRNLPALPRAKNNPEDVDGGNIDHAPDSARYLLSALRKAQPNGGTSALEVFSTPRRPSPGLSPALPGSVGGQTVRRVRRSGF